MDSDDEIPDLIDNSSSDSDEDDADYLPELVPVSPNYYCHVCAVSVFGHVNTTTQEAECDQCHSNFVETLGQGHEHFLNPDLPRPPPPRRNLTTYSSTIGRDRRTPPPAGQVGSSAEGVTPLGGHARPFPRSLTGGNGLNNIMNALFLGGGGIGGDAGGSGGAGFFGGPLGMIPSSHNPSYYNHEIM